MGRSVDPSPLLFPGPAGPAGKAVLASSAASDAFALSRAAAVFLAFAVRAALRSFDAATASKIASAARAACGTKRVDLGHGQNPFGGAGLRRSDPPQVSDFITPPRIIAFTADVDRFGRTSDPIADLFPDLN
jgi:hypothetical protein